MGCTGLNAVALVQQALDQARGQSDAVTPGAPVTDDIPLVQEEPRSARVG